MSDARHRARLRRWRLDPADEGASEALRADAQRPGVCPACRGTGRVDALCIPSTCMLPMDLGPARGPDTLYLSRELYGEVKAQAAGDAGLLGALGLPRRPWGVNVVECSLLGPCMRCGEETRPE